MKYKAFLPGCLTALALFITTSMAFGAQLANYLGTGSNPNLTLTLSTNGPKWEPYAINYGKTGNVPSSSTPDSNWSTWNVADTNGNYYGTITLSSDGNTVTWDSYVAGKNGYYLEGITLSFNKNINSYQLTAKNIHWNPDAAGPFPDAKPAAPARYMGSDQPITLSVKGNKIVDDYGREIKLKGLVRPSLEWNNQGQYLSPTDLQNIAKWNGNVIRIDMNQYFWLNSEPATVKGSYKQIIDAIIYYATQNQMAVILDLHFVEPTGQGSMANQDSIKFWADVAKTYKGFGTVIFELYNEPVNIDKNTWLNGNSALGFVGYQQLYDTVRAQGAKNLVIINGLNWGYDLSFVSDTFKVDGYNIIYGSHPYNNECFANYNGQGGPLEKNLQYVISKYPIFFTEFGDNQAKDYPVGYLPVYQCDVNYIEQMGINYTGFAWWVGEPFFPTMIQDWAGTPLNGGVLVKQDMQQNPATKFFQK